MEMSSELNPENVEVCRRIWWCSCCCRHLTDEEGRPGKMLGRCWDDAGKMLGQGLQKDVTEQQNASGKGEGHCLFTPCGGLEA